MAFRILIVDPDEGAALHAQGVLASAGYSLRLARTFEEGVPALTDQAPDLVITGLRLGPFNGLHLVLRSRLLNPNVATLVMGQAVDHSRDVDSLQVPFLEKPFGRESLLKTVSSLLADRVPRALSGSRQWPRKTTRIPASVCNTEHQIIDLSYGGLRLEGTDLQAETGARIVVTLPTHGVTVQAVARWSMASGEGSWCGAEILDSGTALSAWRSVVDSMN